VTAYVSRCNISDVLMLSFSVVIIIGYKTLPTEFTAYIMLHLQALADRGRGGAASESSKQFFGQSVNFLGSSQEQKMKKIYNFFEFIKRQNGIHSVQRDEMPEVRFSLLLGFKSVDSIINMLFGQVR